MGESNLPSPPFIEIDGISNFRDLGGYPVSSTQSIRSSVIYRCAEPSQVTKNGIEAMQKLGINKVYDLRSNNEIERNKASGRGGVTEWDGCERLFVPVFKDEDYSPENLALRYADYTAEGTEGFVRAYTSILENGPPSYSVILRHLAHKPSEPLIIHCTAGKDRTGVICALVLSLCGVDDEIIAQEYSLTEVGLSQAWKEAVIQHLMSHPALDGNMQSAWNMIGAKAANMRATLGMVREKFGSPENYIVKKCGLSKEEVAMIKGNLIVDKPAILLKVPPVL